MKWLFDGFLKWFWKWMWVIALIWRKGQVIVTWYWVRDRVLPNISESLVKSDEERIIAPESSLDQGPVSNPPISRDRVEIQITIQVIRGPFHLNKSGNYEHQHGILKAVFLASNIVIFTEILCIWPARQHPCVFHSWGLTDILAPHPSSADYRHRYYHHVAPLLACVGAANIILLVIRSCSWVFVSPLGWHPYTWHHREHSRGTQGRRDSSGRTHTPCQGWTGSRSCLQRYRISTQMKIWVDNPWKKTIQKKKVGQQIRGCGEVKESHVLPFAYISMILTYMTQTLQQTYHCTLDSSKVRWFLDFYSFHR